MRRKLITLTSCAICSLLILFLTIQSSSLPHQKNGFKRKFIFSKIKLKKFISLKEHSYYIAGLTNSTLYLGNYLYPNLLFSTTLELKDTTYQSIPSPDTNRLAWGLLHVQVDSPKVYLMEGLTPSFIITDLSFKKAERQNIKCNNFTSSKVLLSNLIIFKTFKSSLSQDILIAQSLNSRETLPIRYFKLEKQLDGRFSLDGLLIRPDFSNKIIYIYLYRNRFVCLDTNLQVNYEGKTIDTNQFAKLIIGSPKGENKISLMTPTTIINREACANDKYIMIYSDLRADNEPEGWLRDKTLDLYAIQNGKYAGSLKIPNSSLTKITGIAYRNHTLFIVTDNGIKAYDFYLD